MTKRIIAPSRRQLLATGAGLGAAAGLGLAPAFGQGAYPFGRSRSSAPGARAAAPTRPRASSPRSSRRISKQPVNVVNRTGGSGVVGHSAIATAAPDGYTIGMVTVEITMMHHQGLTDSKSTSYTPLALVNEDPPGVQVNADEPLQDRERTGRRHQGGTGWQVQSVGHRPGRHLASGADRLADGDGAEAGSRRLGALERCRACDAGSRRRRHRHRHMLGAGSQSDDRCRQGALAGGHGDGAQSAVQGCADAEGSRRRRLFGRRMARDCGAERHSRRYRQSADGGASRRPGTARNSSTS